MEINSLEDIDLLFPNEEESRKYLCAIRWGKWANCPHCGNGKAYFIENGMRFKCANKSCYKKFSVTSLTLMSSTNLDLKKWIISAFLYTKRRGRIQSFDIEKEADINIRTALIIKEKFDFAWPLFNRENKSISEIMEELFKQMFLLYHKIEQFKSVKYNNSYHISDITDIADPKSFDRLLVYCKTRMYCLDYIFIDFATPGEIMTEVFIHLHDNKIKDYDADFIIKIINRTIEKMWYEYAKCHPNIMNRRRDRNNEYKRTARQNLTLYKLVEAVKGTKEGKEMTTAQIKANKELLEKTKKRLTEYRMKSGGLTDFHSHFE